MNRAQAQILRHQIARICPEAGAMKLRVASHLLTLLVFVIVMGVGATPVMAQRTTLFDLLFGGGNQSANPAPPRRVETPAPERAATPSPSVTVLTAPQVDKAEGATRLLVVGDSLATDLAKALERSFAEDPNLIVLNKGVGSSGFVRDDFYDWNQAFEAELQVDSFDMAVVMIGINDRQALQGNDPLTDPWRAIYVERLSQFLSAARAAGKPVIWVGLPPMQARAYSLAISEISSLHRLAVVGNGAEFVDIYERFTDEAGGYAVTGPTLAGQLVTMRKGDGIHFTAEGSDKVAYFVELAMRNYYQGGAVVLEVADLLAGTDAAEMIRLPYQGLGQIRLLEVAGAVVPLTQSQARATELVIAPAAHTDTQRPFALHDLLVAPKGRADAFGLGIEPGAGDTE